MTDVRQVAGRTAHTIPSGKPSPLLRRMARRADALIFIMRASGTSRNVGTFDVSSPAPLPNQRIGNSGMLTRK
jgi:hypothetical protein